MAEGPLARPLGLWLVTLLVAAALLGLGFSLANYHLAPQLEQARLREAEAAGRANRLAALNQSLEERLTRLEAQQAAAPPPLPPGAPGEADSPATRVLHKGEAVVLLNGRLVVALEGFGPERKEAHLKVRAPGGQEGRATLGPGADLGFRLDGQPHRLVLKRILTNSVIFTILPGGRER